MVSGATLNLLTQTCRPLYLPLYAPEKSPEAKGRSSISRASSKSTCDDGRRFRRTQTPWSFRWVHLKVKLAGDRPFRAYDRFSEIATGTDGKTAPRPDPRRQASERNCLLRRGNRRAYEIPHLCIVRSRASTVYSRFLRKLGHRFQPEGSSLTHSPVRVRRFPPGWIG